MSRLIIERGAPARISERGATTSPPLVPAGVEWQVLHRTWIEPLDWSALAPQTPGVPRVVTADCGIRDGDGAWLDGPIVVFGANGTVVAALPSGGPARLVVPAAALTGAGVSLAEVISLERSAPWLCLRALIAARISALRDRSRSAEPSGDTIAATLAKTALAETALAQTAVATTGGSQDTRAALVLLAARQICGQAALLWDDDASPSPAWRRFLSHIQAESALPRGAARGMVTPTAADTKALDVGALASQISDSVLPDCLREAQRYGHVIPAGLRRARSRADMPPLTSARNELP